MPIEYLIQYSLHCCTSKEVAFSGMKCPVLKTTHTHPKDGSWKFQEERERGVTIANGMELIAIFTGMGVQTNKTFHGRGKDIFFEHPNLI